MDVSNKQSCGVLLVPQGREHEWMFSSDDGRKSVAEGTDFGRLFFVTLNRGHLFGSQAEVQAELSPIIRQLAPSCTGAAMPFLAVADDLGSRNIVCQKVSPLSGGNAVLC